MSYSIYGHVLDIGINGSHLEAFWRGTEWDGVSDVT